MPGRSQPFEFVFQAELFFLKGGDAHFIPTGMGHLRFDKLLQSLMFIREFFNVRLHGHLVPHHVEGG